MDPSNPWSWNAFEPSKPNVPHEYRSPKSLAPKDVTQVAGEDRLFQVQNNALKAMNNLRALEGMVDSQVLNSPEWQQLSKSVEGTYKVIRTWLAEHSQQQQGGGFA
jgi:hypothetical protein